MLVLCLLGYPRFLRHDRTLALTILVISICTLGFYGRFDDWSGDWAWGPRFLLPLIPLLVLSMIGLIEAGPTRDWRLRVIAGALAAASVAVQVLSVLVDYQTQMQILHFNGSLPLMYWTPRYSQLAVQADAVWQVLHGTAMYPAVPLPHSHLLQPAYPITWDFWWITAWHANVHRGLLLLLLGLGVGIAVMAGAWIVRSLGRAPPWSPIERKSCER